MKTIVLISCGNRKKSETSKACELYTGALFVNSLQYARKMKPDAIYILSAHHHLLDLDKVIEPYNVTLSYIPKAKRKIGIKILNEDEKIVWGIEVLKRLGEVSDLTQDKYVILASKEYINPLIKGLKLQNVITPLDNMNLFERQYFLKNK